MGFFALCLGLLVSCADHETVILPPHGYAVLVKDPALAQAIRVMGQKYDIDLDRKSFIAQTWLSNSLTQPLSLEARVYFKDPLAATVDVSTTRLLTLGPGENQIYQAESTNPNVVGFAVFLETRKDQPVPEEASTLSLTNRAGAAPTLLNVDPEWLHQSGLTPTTTPTPGGVIPKPE